MKTILEAAAIVDRDMALVAAGLALENHRQPPGNWLSPLAQPELTDLTEEQRRGLAERILNRKRPGECQ